MKIALFNCLERSVPPKKSGGIEKVIYLLLKGLVDRGYEVTLFSTKDSIQYKNSQLIANYPSGIEDEEIPEWDRNRLNSTMTNQLGTVLANMQDKFDIIHNHCINAGLPVLSYLRTAHFSTVHEQITIDTLQRLRRLPNELLTSISYAQRVTSKYSTYIDNIYHGIDISSYPPVTTPDDYFVFVGRISHQKNPHLAIRAAAALKKKIIIVGKYKDEDIETEYYQKFFMPALREHKEYVKWIGELDEKGVNEVVRKAIACLLPVGFEEPFGLAAIQAMAVGCPVIAFNKGAYPETIVNGKTGYVVKDSKEMIEKMKVVSQISRDECKSHVATHFTSDIMVEKYIKLYEKLVQKK